jgi:hypothetical protein
MQARTRPSPQLSQPPGWLKYAGSALANWCIAGCAVAALAFPGLVAKAAGDWSSATVVSVTSLKDSGPGSLRAAIETVNAAPPGTRAVIDLSVSGVITLVTALPAITADTYIDGLTAPGHSPGGPPVAEIDCHGQPGLLFAAGSAGSQLRGVAVDDASGNGVTLDADAITITGDYIGLSLSGAAFGNRGDGVYASSRSSGDFIGLNPSGDPGVVANVISANGGSGIFLAGSSRDVIVANRIGTNSAGSGPIPNGGNGIELTRGANDNEIGGTEYTDPATGQANNPTGSKGAVDPVFIVPPLGNLVSGNRRNGVLISDGSRGNVLNGNFIGTDATGNSAIGNQANGVWIDDAADDSLTGCKFVDNPFVYYNVVSGNGLNGLRVTNSGRVVVQGNFFGIGADNMAIVGNRLNGILVDGTSTGTTVGGVIPLGNVSAGNGRNGIEVTGRARGFTTFNTFGGLLAFGAAAPNGDDGLLITSSGGDNLARTNVFSGNKRNGIELAGDARGVTVDPDIAGLTTNGRAALANGGDGLLIDGSAHGNTIGGSLPSVIPQDTFSGNDGHGIVLSGYAHDNVVFASFVGTQIFGLTAVANLRGGILIAGHAYGNTIGGTVPIPANLISGNTGIGVLLLAGTSQNRVTGNYVGLDRAGRCLPNTGSAIVNAGRGNLILANRTRPTSGNRATCGP